MSKELRIFTLFACGYFISYVFRGINIGFAPFITHELGLSAADLGLLTSLYFLGFAGAQLPAGVMLDHYGARRVEVALLLVAAAGAAIFGLAHGMGGLMLGRLLIGVGVAVCLGGAFKALAQWFPVHRLPLLNGLVMAVGGLGGVVVGSPLNWLLSVSDWRTISFGLAAMTVTMAALLWLGAPEKGEERRESGLIEQLRGTTRILKSGVFWKIASLSAMTQGVFYAVQSLWVAPYLRDVTGLDAPHAASVVSVLGAAMMAGCIGFGGLARGLEKFGLSLYAFSGWGMVIFIGVQLMIMIHVPLPDVVLWGAYGIFGGTGILSYAVMAERFPGHLIGRANTTMTLVIFLLIFACQIGIGAILSLWTPRTVADVTHYPEAAHQTAWGLLVVLQILGAIWYAWPQRERECAAA